MSFFQWPKSEKKKSIFVSSVLLMIWCGLSVLVDFLKNENDFKSSSGFCGVVSQYGYLKIGGKGGSDTWRVIVRTEEYKTKAFIVAASYLHKPLQREGVDIGDDICVHYVSKFPFYAFKAPFIHQIYIDGKAILDPDRVLSIYMGRSQSLYIYMTFLMFFSALASVIQFNYENKGN